MQSHRAHGRGPSPHSTPASSAHPTPPSSPTARFPWGLGAAFALLAAACVLVTAAPTPGLEIHEQGSLGAYSGHGRVYVDPFSSSNSRESMDSKSLHSVLPYLADPTAPWLNLLDANARERSGGWIAHWLGGGEGVVSIKSNGSDGLPLNVSLPHRPAAFPDWLGPNAQLPVHGVLRPFTSLPPPKSTLSDKELPAGSFGWDGEVEEAMGDPIDLRPSEAPERACVSPAWPPVRPSYPLPPFTIALVERGGCDFATKVLAAQKRGAAAVIVGDSPAHPGETDEEGRQRENLITMFSPEDTTVIIIPSVFVSRASYLTLRDLLSNTTVKGKPGLIVELSEATDDGSALGSLLTFALLMPSLFLIATVAAHRVRVARQREANRAPPTVVLSLPERVWGPDIVWEKDDSESDKDEESSPGDEASKPTSTPDLPPSTDGAPEEPSEASPPTQSSTPAQAQGDSDISVAVTAHSVDADDEAEDNAAAPVVAPPRRRGKERRKSKRYYSKDECAICMDNFHKGEVVRILPCGHVFHKDECDEWLLKWRKLCPTCRADVTIPSTDLSASTTITPVVDRTAEGYGATAADAAQPEESGLAHRAGVRLSAMWGSLRAAVARPWPNGEGEGERAPLVAHAV